MKIPSIILKILSIISKILLALFIIVMDLYSCFVADFELVSDFIYYIYNIFFFLFIILAIWGIFQKTFKMLIFTFIAFVIFNNIPQINRIYDRDICLDHSICAEGLQINTEYGLIEVNKDNCEKYGWEWREKGKVCNMRDKN